MIRRRNETFVRCFGVVTSREPRGVTSCGGETREPQRVDECGGEGGGRGGFGRGRLDRGEGDVGCRGNGEFGGTRRGSVARVVRGEGRGDGTILFVVFYVEGGGRGWGNVEFRKRVREERVFTVGRKRGRWRSG